MRMRVSLAALCLLSVTAAVRAEAPSSPLRFVPSSAEFIAVADSPRQLYDAIYRHEAFEELLKFDAVTAQLDTTNFRRFLQLVGFFEKNLGMERFELLDRLTGGGVAFGAKFSDKKPAVLLVVQSRDEKVLRQFVHLARKVLDQELARQGNKGAVQAKAYRDVETLHLGNDLHAAQAGPVLLFSNLEKALHKAIDLQKDGGKDSVANDPGLAEVRKLLPESPLAWAALNLEKMRQIDEFKNTLTTFSLEPIFMFSIGGVVDVIKRSPYVGAALAREGKNLNVRVAMSRGKSGMSPLASMVLPPDENGSLPIIEVPRVQTSTSYFLDLGKFWEERHKILTPEQAKGLDQIEKETAKFLGPLRLGNVLMQAGRYHRIVTAQQEKTAYKKGPPVLGGAFAAVLEMRDPEFAKNMGTILRGAALATSFKYGIRMVEEKHGSHKIVAYYFPENKKFDGDPDGFRFNFSPCFTQTKDQFIVCSTVELARDVLDSLEKGPAGGPSPATSRSRAYAKGLAVNLRSAQELLLTLAILSQGIPPADARKQLDSFIQFVDGLGTVDLDVEYRPSDFCVNLRWNYGQK